jgi:hypothetical protein
VLQAIKNLCYSQEKREAQSMKKVYLDQKYRFLLLMQICFISSATLLTDAMHAIIPKANHLSVLDTYSLWGMPFLLVLTLLYFLVTNRCSRQKSLTVFLYGFGGFFLFSALSIYPYYEVAHASSHTYVALLKKYPGFAGLIDLYRQWPETLLSLGTESFYFLFVNVFFWQHVMNATKPKDAKIIYPLFGISTGIIFFLSSHISAFLLLHKIFYVHFYWMGAIIIALWSLALVCQKRVLGKELSKKDTLSTLESFGYIFTASDFYLVASLTFLFFSMTGLAFFFKISYHPLLWVLYGVIQLGYLLLPQNIRNKSKAIIDILISAFSLWAMGAIFKVGFIFHAFKKVDMKTFTMAVSLMVIGALILLSYVLFKKLQARKLW